MTQGRKAVSERERVWGKAEYDSPEAFQMYSGRRMQTGCKEPLIAAGLGLECRI